MFRGLATAGGVLGVLLILGAYAGVHLDRLDAKRAPALVMNLCGSLLVLLSLTAAFNLPSLIIETAWAAIALYGLWKLRRR